MTPEYEKHQRAVRTLQRVNVSALIIAAAIFSTGLLLDNPVIILWIIPGGMLWAAAVYTLTNRP